MAGLIVHGLHAQWMACRGCSWHVRAVRTARALPPAGLNSCAAQPPPPGSTRSHSCPLPFFPLPLQASGDPEFIVENVLATALLTLAALAAAFVVLKLLIVLYSLISAAFRYTVVGVFLVVALVAFQPGRWWF